MSLGLNNGRELIKNKGFFTPFQKGSLVYLLSLLYLPFCFFNVRKIKFNNIKSTVDFVYSKCQGYLAPMQIKSEIESFLNIVKKSDPRIILEIGSAKGGTLFLFSKIMPPNSLLISIDLPRGNFGGGYPLWKIPLYRSFATGNQKIALIRGNSHKRSMVNKVKSILAGRKIDVLFIDGDHSYEGVKKDFFLYKPLVKKGGYIALHDIVHHPPEFLCEVDKFWKEIKKKHSNKEFIEDKKQKWAGIGLIKV